MINNSYDIETEKVMQECGACPECDGIVEHEGAVRCVMCAGIRNVRKREILSIAER